MSELFLELFSEEMPPKLQISARENLLQNIINFFKFQNIGYDKNYYSTSTPNRLIIYFKKVELQTIKKSKEIKGPSVGSSEEKLNGFINSYKIPKNKIYKKKLGKDEFFFYKTKEEKINTKKLLQNKFPEILSQVKWKKSMRWGSYDLFWGRPLKSIMSIFNGNVLSFSYYHLRSSNKTFIDQNEGKLKSFQNYFYYKKFFKNHGIIVDHNERKKIIENTLYKISNSKNFKLTDNNKLIDEVTNILERPKVIFCSFNKSFLNMPEELIINTIEKYQKNFLVYDRKNKLTNNFFVVSNCHNKTELIKKGYEKVVEARLFDADYFWKKNKSKNMIKQVFQLKDINYFTGLGNYLNKAERLKKLGGLISDNLLISKEKVEVAATICKVDLISELVNEFPELQGLLGGYFAEAQGFEKEVCLSIKEHYLPTGQNSKVPKNNYSITLALSDKIDTLVGFFGIDLIPSSSKDPYGLRRLSIGLIKIVIENKKNLKIRELINYSYQLYNDQSIKINNENIVNDLTKFISERFKYFMKEKGIRNDIIDTSLTYFDLDNLLKIYNKANKLNKVINKQTGIDLIESYKRAFNILNSEMKFNDKITDYNIDPELFKNKYEKNLYDKINDIRKNLTSINIEYDYEAQLSLLASIKRETSEFFENVIVNDKDKDIKNNRLQLLKMLCKTFDNYLNFNKIEISV
tara:strand:- start:4538 stop:6607 length:2070 start_codon:yes stop_codon:yes gene_type:complete